MNVREARSQKVAGGEAKVAADAMVKTWKIHDQDEEEAVVEILTAAAKKTAEKVAAEIMRRRELEAQNIKVEGEERKIISN